MTPDQDILATPDRDILMYPLQLGHRYLLVVTLGALHLTN